MLHSIESVRKSAGQVDLPPFSADRCCVSKNSSLYLERVGAGGWGGGGGGGQSKQNSLVPFHYPQQASVSIGFVL